MKVLIAVLFLLALFTMSCKSDKGEDQGEGGDDDFLSDGDGLDAPDGDFEGDGDSSGQLDGNEVDGDSSGQVDGNEADEDSSGQLDGNDENDADSFEGCAEVSASAELKKIPADIVFVVDNSGSMTLEASLVQENMNKFSTQIIGANVDVHVVLISAGPSDEQGICIEGPLGKEGMCPNNDTNLPIYHHEYRTVSSVSALEDILATYDKWKFMRRENGSLHFIIVSDDESKITMEQFNTGLGKLTNPPVENYTLHAIVSMESPAAAKEHVPPGPCAKFAEKEGVRYKQIANATKGIIGDLCSQEFGPIFDKMAEGISDLSFECEWAIPSVPAGQVFDKKKVNVDFKDDAGTVHSIKNVDLETSCVSGENGWYYDDLTNPSKILLCPETCALMRSQTKPAVDIKFGCKTIQ